MIVPFSSVMQRAPRLGDVLHQEHNSLGLMRLAMATAVLVSHCFYLASGTALAEPLIGWTGYTLGQHGVQVFFIMSGVLVMQSLMMSGSVRDYAIARALRIFPALAVCILITALIVGPALTRLPLATYLNSPETPGYIVKTIMLVTGMAPLPGLFADNPVPGLVNSSLWTLKYEVICYILLAAFSAIALASGRHRAVFIAALAVAVPLIFYKRPELAKDNGLIENVRYFALFFGTGVVAYIARNKLVLTGFAVPFVLAGVVTSIDTPIAELAMAVGLGYMALWLATFRFGSLRAFTNDQDYSYGVYIYSVPVTQALLHFHPRLDVVSLIAVTLSLTLPLAFLSWNWIERPALRLRHVLRTRADDASIDTDAGGALVPISEPDIITRLRKATAPQSQIIVAERLASPATATTTITPVQAPAKEQDVSQISIRRLAQAARIDQAELEQKIEPLRPAPQAGPDTAIKPVIAFGQRRGPLVTTPVVSNEELAQRPRMSIRRPISVPN
jgi:peptidoglycan/LPS O-acetylase OafA/YrhL